MTLEEAKTAIQVANDHFATYERSALTRQNIEGKEVNILFERHGNRYDYGIPSMYVLDKKYLDDLKNWWKGLHPKTGVVLPPEAKGGDAYQVNLQWMSESDELFNLHLSVTR
ncbi:MAG TPA: hypothetical protein VJZ77_16320 [Blastocatellia bacterium]|nr:hypothetical protein [Blastocatellia bacterium]